MPTHSCYAMQDYAEEGSNSILQVFHDSKMLHEVLSSPAVQVEGNIYFVEEILQDCTGNYFFPKRFFCATRRVAEGMTSSPEADKKEVYALGCPAEQTEVSTIPTTIVRVVQLWVNSGTTGVTVLDGTLASAYVLRPCCCSCSIFRRCQRQIEKERRRGVILVDIQAKVHSGVSTSLYMEAKVD